MTKVRSRHDPTERKRIYDLAKQPGETESAMMRRSQQLRSRVRHNRRQVEHHQQLADPGDKAHVHDRRRQL